MVPSTSAALTVRPYADTDFAAMAALFESIFQQPMSRAFHAWKYRPGTSGAVVVYKDAELVGHYGGIGTRILMQGVSATAIQIVDVMIKPSVRAAVRTHSPFFLAGSRFLDTYIGDENPYLLGYGFPSDRHLRLAQRLGLYAPVGHITQLEWDVEALAKAPGLFYRSSVITAANFAMHASTLDQCWVQMRKDFTNNCLVIKDAAFSHWRYLSNPDRDYELLLLEHRLTGKPLGLVVLKYEADQVLLMDVIASKQHFARLMGLAAARAQEAGRALLRTWTSGTDYQVFSEVKARVEALPIAIPANIWTPGPGPESLQDRWWLMPGDTDFL